MIRPHLRLRMPGSTRSAMAMTDYHHGLEVLGPQSRVLTRGWCRRRAAGDVDQDVDRPKLFLNGGYTGVNDREVGKIPSERKGLGAGSLDFLDGLFSSGHTDVGSCNSCSFMSQSIGNCPAKILRLHQGPAQFFRVNLNPFKASEHWLAGRFHGN